MADTQEILLTVTCPAFPDTFQVDSISGHEELGELFSYSVVLASDKPNLDLTALLATPMTVHLSLGDGKVRHFNGIVMSAAREREEDNRTYYSVQLHPEQQLLTYSHNCRIFQNKKVLDVVQEVVGLHGLRACKSQLYETYRTWDYLTQYHESDWAFIRRMLALEGIYFYFNHLEDAHEMVLVDSSTAHDPFPGFPEVPLHSGSESLRIPDYLRGWQSNHTIQTNSVSLRDFEFRLRHPASVLQAASAVDSKRPLERYEYPGNFALKENELTIKSEVEREEGVRLAKVRLEEKQNRKEIFSGEGTARWIHAGCLLGISNSTEYTGKQFLIISTDVEFRNPSFDGGASVSERSYVQLRATPKENHYRIPRIEKPVVKGPQTAIVVGPKGEEIWTDDFSRIKVQFHWDRQGKNNEDSSCWIRVAQPWAGKNWGAIHIPRIGNEVVVEFLEGDPDRPLVTGSVYNLDNPVPYKLPKNKTQSGIKTRSSKGATDENFNEIRFEDLKGKEELHMQAERDMSTLVKRNQSLSVGVNRDISVGGDESTTINKYRRLHVVEDEFINIDGCHTNTVVKDVVETFMQNHDIDVSQDKTEHVAQTYTLTTDKKFSLNQAATNLTFEGTNVTLDAAGTVLVKRGPAEMLMDGAGKIKLSTSAAITLECGPSKIEMTPSGIKITSPQVIAEATPSKLELGPAAASLTGAMVKVEAQTICSVMGMATLKLNTP